MTLRHKTLLSSTITAIAIVGVCLAVSYMKFHSLERAQPRMFSCMSWTSSGINRNVGSPALAVRSKYSACPDQHLVWGEVFTDKNAGELLQRCYNQDRNLCCELKTDILSRGDGQGPPLYLYVAVWAVFHIEREAAIPFLKVVAGRYDSSGESAKRCIERLLLQPGTLNDENPIFAHDLDSLQVQRDHAFLLKCGERLERRGLKHSAELTDAELVSLYSGNQIEGIPSYRIDHRFALSSESLFQMRLLEIIATRHPGGKCCPPAGFPLGYPDRSYVSWSNGVNDLVECLD